MSAAKQERGSAAKDVEFWMHEVQDRTREEERLVARLDEAKRKTAQARDEHAKALERVIGATP